MHFDADDNIVTHRVPISNSQLFCYEVIMTYIHNEIYEVILFNYDETYEVILFKIHSVQERLKI